MFNNDARSAISVPISVDDDRLVSIGVTVTVTVDDHGFVAIAAPISISMDRYTTRSYSDANVVSQNRRYGANARDGAYNKCCADHNGTSPWFNELQGKFKLGPVVPNPSS